MDFYDKKSPGVRDKLSKTKAKKTCRAGPARATRDLVEIRSKKLLLRCVGCGLFLFAALFLLRALLAVGGLILGKNGSAASEQRQTEHQTHDLFHFPGVLLVRAASKLNYLR